jgi:hypothetical protein
MGAVIRTTKAGAGKGYITIGQARHIMRELGACEPDDRAVIIRQFSAPSLCRQDSGSEFWPINIGPGSSLKSRLGLSSTAQKTVGLPMTGPDSCNGPSLAGSLHRWTGHQLYRASGLSRFRVLIEVDPCNRLIEGEGRPLCLPLAQAGKPMISGELSSVRAWHH